MMFSKSKADGKRKAPAAYESKNGKGGLAQFGLLDVPNIPDFSVGVGDDDDEDDADLEAELLSLMGSDAPIRIPSNHARTTVDKKSLDKMVAQCMVDEDDDDLVDEDDPDLLAELSALRSDNDNEENADYELTTGQCSIPNKESKAEKNVPLIVQPSPVAAGHSVLNLLNERLKMYETAKQNALAADDSSRARRLTRGLTTIEQMLRSVRAGKSINEEDIPPAVILQSSRNNSHSDLSQSNVTAPTDIEAHPPVVQESLPSPQRPSSIQQNIIFKDTSDMSSTSITSEPVNASFPPVSSSSSSTQLMRKKEMISSVPPSMASTLAVIQKLHQEYKFAALEAKKYGDKENAIHYMRTMKQLDPLLEAVKNNQPVDLDSLPPSPSQYKVLQETKNDPPSVQSEVLVNVQSNVPDDQENTKPIVSSNPASLLEALELRLQKYIEQKDKAKVEGNGRKERMNGRIVKQYQDAIRSLKMGRAVDFTDLPCPPNFPDLPKAYGSNSGPVNSPSLALTDNSNKGQQFPSGSGSVNSSVPVAQQSSKENISTQAHSSGDDRNPSAGPAKLPLAPVKSNVRKNPQSRVERQLSLLKSRQTMFKDAALEAKKKGEIEQAKEFLRNYKGLTQLIDVASGGLPVDMNTVPIPPQEKLTTESSYCGFEVVDKDECSVVSGATEAEVGIAYAKLEEDLISQIKMCAQTREHFKAIGDVASANRFEQEILNTKKDLDAVRISCNRGDRPPKFHYENRTFTLIQCNTDLNDSDCEVTIVRGVNFNTPNASETDTYVKIEFPYPSDTPPQERTSVVKGTNNPEFNHKVVFSIDRKVRSLPRIFKRHFVKCQVVSKGGWFHRDSVLGSVKVALAPLETKCTHHESFDLVDERKKMVGGKLEVKVRVRNPILSKQLERVTERWIVIDGF